MIAFIFPGQGSQKVGMGRALSDAFPICRETFAEADAALGEPLSRIIFEGPEDRLTLTENTQPAILAVSVAAERLLASRGITPAFVAGHSLGEYSANVAAGTFSFADALRLVRRRGRYMQDAVPAGEGAMAAILGLDAEKVAQACAEAADGAVVSPANLNGAGQIVIAGAAAAVARAGERAKALGARRVVPLPSAATMAEFFPIRSSAPREPDRRPRPIPRKVRQAIELLVYGKPDDEDCRPVDLVTAANEVGLRPYVLRRYLDRGNVRAALLRERRAFRAAICGANELALKRVRDNSANGMCVVASVRQLEAMDADDGGRSVHAPTPGIVIKIINQSAPPVDASNVIDVTPAPAIDSSYPIFKPPGY